MSAESQTACPTCGADGVTGCDTPDQSDHPGRPPFFDDRTAAVLDLMARGQRK